MDNTEQSLLPILKNSTTIFLSANFHATRSVADNFGCAIEAELSVSAYLVNFDSDKAIIGAVIQQNTFGGIYIDGL